MSRQLDMFSAQETSSLVRQKLERKFELLKRYLHFLFQRGDKELVDVIEEIASLKPSVAPRIDLNNVKVYLHQRDKIIAQSALKSLEDKLEDLLINYNELTEDEKQDIRRIYYIINRT